MVVGIPFCSRGSCGGEQWVVVWVLCDINSSALEGRVSLLALGVMGARGVVLEARRRRF